MLSSTRAVVLSAAVVLGACGGGDDTTDGSDDVDVHVGTNDVSILLPLPTSAAQADELLTLASLGVGGPLLPEAQFDAISVFSDNPTENRSYAAWRIVAARIDPCFPSLALLATDPTACRRQLRLVAQPLQTSPKLGIVALDATIHLFFDQDEATFRAMAAAFVGLQTTTTKADATRLTVHPTIATEGLEGATQAALRDLITTYAGAARLTQVTFMEGRGVAWEFGGMRIDAAGARTDIAIPGLAVADGNTRQTNGSDFNGVFGVTPASTESTQLETALAGTVVGDPENGAAQVELQAPVGDIEAALQLSLDLDNPTSSFDPDTVDCVSCHVAGRARDRAALLGFPSDGMARFSNRRDLSLAWPQQNISAPTAMRMFGYNEQVVFVGQRVVNESAAVADAIEALLAP